MNSFRSIGSAVLHLGKQSLRPMIAAGTALGLMTNGVVARNCKVDAMIVFDGSGSMSEVGFNRLDEPRIFDARQAMRESVPPIAATRNLGLIIYGPGTSSACANIDVRFGPIPDSAGPIVSAIDDLIPAGETPLTTAVEQAAEVLDYQTQPGVVVLVTDGKETCGGAPCQLAAQLSADAVDLTVHVIGFKVRGEHFSWAAQDNDEYSQGRTVARCLADRTGGEYFSTESTDELINALRVALSCAAVS